MAPVREYSPLQFLSTVCSGLVVLVAFVFVLHPFPTGPNAAISTLEIQANYSSGDLYSKVHVLINYAVLITAAFINCVLNARQLRKLARFVRTSSFARTLSVREVSSFHAVPMALTLNLLVLSVVFRSVLPVPEFIIQALIYPSLLLLGVMTAVTIYILLSSLQRTLRSAEPFSAFVNNNLYVASYALALQSFGFLAFGKPSTSTEIQHLAQAVAAALCTLSIACLVAAFLRSVLSIAHDGVRVHNLGIFWWTCALVPMHTIVLTTSIHSGGVLSASPNPYTPSDSLILHFWLLAVLLVQGLLAFACAVLLIAHPHHRDQLVSAPDFNPATFILSLPGVSFALMVAFIGSSRFRVR